MHEMLIRGLLETHCHIDCWGLSVNYNRTVLGESLLQTISSINTLGPL